MPNVLAFISILGSTLLLIADVVLVYTPISSKEFNVFSAAVGKSARRLVWGGRVRRGRTREVMRL
jgi:hypothetical protein